MTFIFGLESNLISILFCLIEIKPNDDKIETIIKFNHDNKMASILQNFNLLNGVKQNDEKSISTIIRESVPSLSTSQIYNLLKFNHMDVELQQNWEFIYEIIGLLNVVKYDDIIEFLESVQNYKEVSSRTIFEHFYFEKQRLNYIADISRIRDKIEQEGLVKCRKCGSGNTISVTVQTRSADEAADVMVTCNDCLFKFKE